MKCDRRPCDEYEYVLTLTPTEATDLYAFLKALELDKGPYVASRMFVALGESCRDQLRRFF